MKRISLRMAVVILALAVCLAPVAQAAEKADETSLSADLGLGVPASSAPFRMAPSRSRRGSWAGSWVASPTSSQD